MSVKWATFRIAFHWLVESGVSWGRSWSQRLYSRTARPDLLVLVQAESPLQWADKCHTSLAQHCLRKWVVNGFPQKWFMVVSKLVSELSNQYSYYAQCVSSRHWQAINYTKKNLSWWGTIFTQPGNMESCCK